MKHQVSHFLFGYQCCRDGIHLKEVMLLLGIVPVVFECLLVKKTYVTVASTPVDVFVQAANVQL